MEYGVTYYVNTDTCTLHTYIKYHVLYTYNIFVLKHYFKSRSSVFVVYSPFLNKIVVHTVKQNFTNLLHANIMSTPT